MIIIWLTKKKWNKFYLENINYTKVNNILSVLNFVLASFVQGVSVQGVYVLGGLCPSG